MISKTSILLVSLLLALGFTQSCNKSSKESAANEENLEIANASENENPGIDGVESEASVISNSENRDNLDAESLVPDQVLFLTIGLDPTDLEIESLPENGKVTYYDVQSLSEAQKELGETETDIEGEAALTLDLPQYYIIRVEFKHRGMIKALVAPELLGEQDPEEILDIRINRKTTIITDIFEVASLNSSTRPLAHSMDISFETLERAAKAYKEKVNTTVAKSERVAFYKSEHYKSSINAYANNLISSLLTITDYDKDFEGKKIQESIDSIDLIPSQVDLSFEVAEDSSTACMIKLDSCARRPDRVGTFKDNYQDAGSDYDRCLRRAHEYHRWCGNSADEEVSASFEQEGEVLVALTSSVPFSGCYIKQDTCNRDPLKVGQFIDNYKSSSTDQDRCMMRAHDFHRWCQNTSDSITLASFYSKGVLKKQIDSKTPYTGCFVQLDMCKKKESRAGFFIDNGRGASTDVDVCMMRAHDHHRSCGNDSDIRTVASFYDKGKLIQQLDSQTPYTGCFIEQDTCTARPERVGLFIDNYRSASTDADQCLRRAHDFHRWCKNGADNVTTASFYDKGQLVSQSSSAVPYTGCFIQLDKCERFPERVGLFVDNYQNASSDTDRCMMRAHDYHKWCQNGSEDVTTAGMYDKGNLVQKLDSQTPYTGCFLQIDSCERKPEWEGLRVDNYQSASTDKDRCMMRAHDYHRSCANSFDKVIKASFYEKGEQKATIGSDTPYTGCFIRQDTCVRRADKVGLFYDNYQNASFDKDRCLARAQEYHNWCKNDATQATSAEFYDKGTLIEKETVN